MTSRKLAISASLALSLAGAAAIAGCAAFGTPPANSTPTQQALAEAGAAIAYLQPVAPLLALVSPAAAVYVPDIEGGLTAALSALNGISSTLTADQAKPQIAQIASALGVVLDSADKAVATIADATKRVQAQAILAAARDEVKLLTQFSTGTAPAMQASRTPGMQMLVRTVR